MHWQVERVRENNGDVTARKPKVESVIMAAAHGYDTKIRARVPDRYRISEGGSGVTVVEDGESRIYISRSPSVRDELEPEQLPSIEATIPDPVFYTIDYSDITFCRELLIEVANDAEVLIDNDHGLMARGSDFVSMLRSRRDWDWRKDGVGPLQTGDPVRGSLKAEP